MTALSKIAYLKPEEIYNDLDTVIKAYENGCVITVDNAISVFAEICKANEEYERDIFILIIKHLETCRPQHSERIFICVNRK